MQFLKYDFFELKKHVILLNKFSKSSAQHFQY